MLLFGCIFVFIDLLYLFVSLFLDTRGWDEWSIWSTCGFDGIKYRHRSCQLVSPLPNECQGYGVEYQSCIKDGDGKYLGINRSEPYKWKCFNTQSELSLLKNVLGFRSFQKFDLEKERRNHQRKERKRKTGSFASQLSLDFLTVNNKVYDSTTLSKERNTIRRDGSLQNQMRTNLRNNEV
ncbi:hypothetical protein KUTeg_015186 [Tegillarca granosa]|uniref:Uncharacterized protein n=1 Tax=Tegillarca granosa TaxID=220873 RepID=A0ABQ9EPE2_TEGGR|nr:hypothetical protein KUTeg_015186 [Tegillarca granosa]